MKGRGRQQREEAQRWEAKHEVSPSSSFTLYPPFPCGKSSCFCSLRLLKSAAGRQWCNTSVCCQSLRLLPTVSVLASFVGDVPDVLPDAKTEARHTLKMCRTLQKKLHRKFDLVISLGKCAGAFLCWHQWFTTPAIREKPDPSCALSGL